MKKSVWMLLALLVFFLTGCGNSKTGTAQGEESKESTDAKADPADEKKPPLGIPLYPLGHACHLAGMRKQALPLRKKSRNWKKVFLPSVMTVIMGLTGSSRRVELRQTRK